MKHKAEVVVIGGGINGLGIAYNLAKMGVTDVVVLEQKYIGWGASGRNPGGVRQQWNTKENIILARESVKIFEHLSQELNYNILFRQRGYLILAFTEEEVEEYKKNVKLQNSLGVPSRLVTPEKAKEIVPTIDETKILAATYCPTDGVLFPYALFHGYENAAKRLGVQIYTFTKATGINVENGKIKSVMTNHGEIQTNKVVNAAGGFSSEVAKLAGVELPNRPYRREIMVTEPLEIIIEPMVISLHHGLYVTQSMRGEIIGGIGNPNEKPGFNIRSTADFPVRFAKALVDIMPNVRYVSMLRQWAGVYDVTPDARPILGEVDEVEGFYQANGFSGHGVMISAIVDKLIAELIVTGKTSIPIDSLNLRRFKEQELSKEGMVV
ncbi:MAG: FAD-binding oxidoreductase [Candidatus Odinarchaeota archaeon]|nr:FAD-binding oxidoreductase [Candidatus Odinarchaeota archaeon]